MAYSSGKYSYGICDKTGFRYATKDLVFEFIIKSFNEYKIKNRDEIIIKFDNKL